MKSRFNKVNSFISLGVFGMLYPYSLQLLRIAMVTLTKEVRYVDSFVPFGSFLLIADIGGTNSNIGIFRLSDEPPLLLLSLHFASKEISNFTTFIQEVSALLKANYGLLVHRACLGAAGLIGHNRTQVKPTNLPFTIDLEEIARNTDLKELFLINDFEAVALGIELLNPASIISINHKQQRGYGNKAFLGAGTGLGKSVLLWYSKGRQYIPISSEGGHADAAFYYEHELSIHSFIKAECAAGCPVSWEDLLSGLGIQRLYKFLGTQNNYQETPVSKLIADAEFDPDRISAYAKEDQRCKDTLTLYTRFYARCAKNFVLELIALGGLYIAGGIAAKNISLFFDPLFMIEFTDCVKHKEYLSSIPVFVIADYNVSLYGGVVAMQMHLLNLL